MDVLEALNLESFAVFYYDESDVLLWKDFMTAQASKRFMEPKFVKIDRTMEEFEIM